MIFKNIENISDYGFDGLFKIEQLKNNNKLIHDEKGVYMVLFNGIEPLFLEKGTCRFYKDRDPNVMKIELNNNWVDNAVVLYSGKSNNLQSRIKQYLSISRGKKSPHWGGRLIWQLENSNYLIICWKTTPEVDPRSYERMLIKEFCQSYNKRPFANLSD